MVYGAPVYNPMMMVEEGSSSSLFHRPRQPTFHNAQPDLGNVTIEHVPEIGTQSMGMYLVEEKCEPTLPACFMEDDVLEIGIEANDLNSLLEQFEETEATLKIAETSRSSTPQPVPPPEEVKPVSNINNNAGSPFKAVKKTPIKKDVDPREVAKKIVPAKRKSAILLEPQSMPAKRVRGKPAPPVGSERGCHSLPGSRSGSPIPHSVPKTGGKLPGFNYLNLEHDYCTDKSGKNKPVGDGDKSGKTKAVDDASIKEKQEIELLAQEHIEQIQNARNERANKAKDPVAAKAAAHERKQLYKKRQYKLKKKADSSTPTPNGSRAPTPESSEQGDSNLPTPLMSPDPDLMSPNPDSSETPTSPNTSPTRSSSSFVTPSASPNVSKLKQSVNAVQERRLQYFDKIPDYFPNKLFSMYQEIGTTDAKVEKKEVDEAEKASSEANSYSQMGAAGSDTSFSHTVNTDASFSHTINTTFTSPTTNNCDESCSEMDAPEKVGNADDGEIHAQSPSCSRASSCSRARSPSRSPSPRIRRKSTASADSRYSGSHSSYCSTCSPRSRSRSRSYSSYTSRSRSPHSRSRSRSPHSRSRSRIPHSRSRSRSHHSRSRSRSHHSRSRSRTPHSRSRSRTPHSRSRSRSHHSRSRSPRSRSRSRSYSRSRSRSVSSQRSRRSRSRHRKSSRHHKSPRVRLPTPDQTKRDRHRRSHRRRRRKSSYRSRSGHSYRSRSRSRSRSKSRSRSRSRHSRRRRRRSHRVRSSASREREREWKQKRWNEQMEKQKRQWEDRRVIYVGRIDDNCSKAYLDRRFGHFGEIDKITVHFRDEGDNYAFVTFKYTCDAFAAIEGVNQDKNEPQYDVCFGGRRQFCRTDYADLDSMNKEEEAFEFGYKDVDADDLHEAVPASGETDFDRLLKQAMKKAKLR